MALTDKQITAQEAMPAGWAYPSEATQPPLPPPLVPPPLPPPVVPPPPAKDARGVGSCEQSCINIAEFLVHNLNYCLDGKTHLIIRRADGNSFVYPLSYPLVPIKETDKLELAWGPLTPESEAAVPAVIRRADGNSFVSPPVLAWRRGLVSPPSLALPYRDTNLLRRNTWHKRKAACSPKITDFRRFEKSRSS